MTDGQKAKILALEAKQLRYAKHWETQPKRPIPDDEYPPEWHIANRWRCIHNHVRVGVTRLHGCRECARKGNRNIPDMPVVRTSPVDESGPFDLDEEIAAAGLGEVVLEPDPRGSNTGHLR